jgi:alpha-galactosidase
MRGAHVQAIQLKLGVMGTNYTVDEIIDPSGVCPWWSDFYALNMSHPGARPFYNSLYKQYAEWGLGKNQGQMTRQRDESSDSQTLQLNFSRF